MRQKRPIPLSQKFPNADPNALRLLERMLAFDPKDRPSAEEVQDLIFLKLFLYYLVLYASLLMVPMVLQVVRLLQIHISRTWPELRESLLLNQLQKWNLNLKDEG